MAKEARVTGSLLRPLPEHEKTAIARNLRKVVWPLIEAGAVKPVIQRVLPLRHAALAHECMESGELAGKIILEVVDANLGRQF